MRDYKLTDLVKGTVVFLRLERSGDNNRLWYQVEGEDFMFPVPLEDTEGATFEARDKAMLFMRWIRKHLNLIRESQGLEPEEEERGPFMPDYGEMTDPIRVQAIWEIEQERARQNGKWGGPKHDDDHIPKDWTRFIADHNQRVLVAVLDSDAPAYRYQLVRVAALALAALESDSRLRARDGLPIGLER